MSINRKSQYTLVCLLMLLFTVSGHVLVLFPFSMNRIILPVIILALLLISVQRLRPVEIIACLLLFWASVYTTVIAADIGLNTEDLLYFLTGVLWLLFIADDRRRAELTNAFVRNSRVINVVMYASIGLILAGLLVKGCYRTYWGGNEYYVGFAGIEHTMASCVCAVATLYLFQTLNKRFSWLHMGVLIALTFAVLETGARTFIVPMAIILYLYIRHSLGSLPKRLAIYGVGLVIMVFVFMSSVTMSKFAFLTSGDAYGYSGGMDGLTTGRTLIWQTDMQAFFAGDWMQVLFGQGFDSIYVINRAFHSGSLWAHNDFINLLVCAGVAGALVYTVFFVRALRNPARKCGRGIDQILLITYAFFPAFFNGFYKYQNYLVSFVILCVCYEYGQTRLGWNLRKQTQPARQT